MDKKAMLGKLIELVIIFDGLTNGALQYICGPIKDMLEKLAGDDGEKWLARIKRLLRGEEPTRRWREKDGVIYFRLTSDGTTGRQWIDRLKAKGLKLEEEAKHFLLSSEFKPTIGVITEVAILKDALFGNNEQTPSKIHVKAGEYQLIRPKVELACLISDNFSIQEMAEMGLTHIVIMHELLDGLGFPCLLGVRRADDCRYFYATDCRASTVWSRGVGFAFAVWMI